MVFESRQSVMFFEIFLIWNCILWTSRALSEYVQKAILSFQTDSYMGVDETWTGDTFQNGRLMAFVSAVSLKENFYQTWISHMQFNCTLLA